MAVVKFLPATLLLPAHFCFHLACLKGRIRSDQKALIEISNKPIIPDSQNCYRQFCGSRVVIPDPGRKDPGSGSASDKVLLIQKICTKLSIIWCGMFIPDFFLSRILNPDPGVKKAPDPRKTGLQVCIPSHNRPWKVSTQPSPNLSEKLFFFFFSIVLLFVHKCFSGLKSPRLLPNRFYLPSQVLLEMLQLAHHALHNGCLVRFLSRHPPPSPR